jgi:hypothetical protein
LAKKWYSYFVVTDQSTDVADPSAATGVPPASEPQRVTDVVSDADAATKFATTVQNVFDLGEVYEAAKIGAPAHGYTVLKVADMLQSEHIRTLPGDVKRKSIMVALDAAGVKVTDIVEDAVRRDRALDTYERVQQKSLDDLQTKKDEENRRIQQEMEKVLAEQKAKMQANTDEVSRAVDAFRAWRLQKQQEEQGIDCGNRVSAAGFAKKTERCKKNANSG